jgi:hypothetical protein
MTAILISITVLMQVFGWSMVYWWMRFRDEQIRTNYFQGLYVHYKKQTKIVNKWYLDLSERHQALLKETDDADNV